jgi:hypothetical protein
MVDLVEKSKRILAAVDAFVALQGADTRLALRKCVMDELESAGVLAVRELENIVNAKRFDREVFDDDTGFADWVQSRARFTLAKCDATPGEACHCEACDPIKLNGSNMRMIVCAKCGNKRCPHATDHRNACTNNNDPGQKGSSWEHYKPPGTDGLREDGNV